MNLLQLYQSQVYQSRDSSNVIEETQRQLNKLLSRTLPNTRELAFWTIALANSYKHVPTDPLDCYRAESAQLAKSWLEKAEQTSRNIGDLRALSFSEGYLGHVYQCLGDKSEARKQFQEAQLNASAANAADSEYLWHWLEGSIYERQGRSHLALETYDRAIHRLETIRVDILTAEKDLQFNFRDAVEPLYRNTIKLQLQLMPSSDSVSMNKTANGAESPTSLNSTEGVLKTVDALKLAQLQNYFGDDCQLEPIEEKDVVDVQDEDNSTATISTIIFPERTILILSRPNEQPIIEEINESSDKMREISTAYLEAVKTGNRDYQHTCNPQGGTRGFVCDKQLYVWIIGPFGDVLSSSQV